MMRITGGLARGIRLQTPTGTLTRPATDQMREAVFSSLGQAVVGVEVVDWFAGTGAYGLEALSRGASHCSFFELDPQAINCLKVNIQSLAQCLGKAPQAIASITRCDLLAPANAATRLNQAQLVFVDPPYERLDTHWQPILDRIGCTCIADDGRVIFEVPGDWHQDPIGWQTIKRLGKNHRGKPNVLILNRQATSA
jgi:16S rRNA (guanine966-N2)-methyltransferase